VKALHARDRIVPIVGDPSVAMIALSRQPNIQ
jgi:hypothetical protein